MAGQALAPQARILRLTLTIKGHKSQCSLATFFGKHLAKLEAAESVLVTDSKMPLGGRIMLTFTAGGAARAPRIDDKEATPVITPYDAITLREQC